LYGADEQFNAQLMLDKQSVAHSSGTVPVATLSKQVALVTRQGPLEPVEQFTAMEQLNKSAMVRMGWDVGAATGTAPF
jgi:hypothetical protein